MNFDLYALLNIHYAGCAIGYRIPLSIFDFLYISPLQIIDHNETPPLKLVANVFLKLQFLQFNTPFHTHLKTSMNYLNFTTQLENYIENNMACEEMIHYGNE